ncbi:MAG: hypothetical protein ACLTAI_02810 [Thomasclavelia sp.]
MFYGKYMHSISFNSYPGCGFEVIIESGVGKGYVYDILVVEDERNRT